MKTYLIDSGSGIDAIKQVDRPEPKPGPGEVVVEIKAASLNYRDLGVAQGGYFRNDTRPVVPLSDAAGVVAQIGDQVDRWKVGDRVTPNFVRDWIDGPPTDAALRTSLGGGIDGVLTQYAVFPQQSLLPIPESLDFAEAATVPCAAVTAWHALMASGNLQAGQSVLLLGTGGVSIFAMQIAKSVGASVILTSSSDDKIATARSTARSIVDWSASDHAINYRQCPDWHKEVKRITDGRGVDHVVEVGGPGTLERSLKSAAVGGHVHLIGVLDSPAAKVGPMISVFNLLTIRGIYVGSQQMHRQTLDMIASSNIRPVIDRRFGFEEAIEAYRYFSTQKHVGKIVIEF